MGISSLLDNLTKFHINVWPVLEYAANQHESMYSAEIAGFTLPTWMFKKLSQEEGFELAGSKWMGRYSGYTIFCQNNATSPRMAERGSRFLWRVL